MTNEYEAKLKSAAEKARPLLEALLADLDREATLIRERDLDPRKLAVARRAHPALRVGFCFDDTMLDFTRPVLDRLVPRRSWRSAEHAARANPHVALEGLLGADVVGQLAQIILAVD